VVPESSNDQDLTGRKGNGCSSAVNDDVVGNHAVTHFAGLHMTYHVVHFSWIASQGTGVVNVHHVDMAMY
jgi:hypothetical protein